MDLTNYHQFAVRLKLNTKVVILSFLFQFDISSSITFWNVTTLLDAAFCTTTSAMWILTLNLVESKKLDQHLLGHFLGKLN